VVNLVKDFDSPDPVIIPNSYGAYLLMQAMLERVWSGYGWHLKLEVDARLSNIT
jgi:hypothetical protein